MRRTIAFIGLGHMGLPMAVNLHKAGYNVTGYDVSETAQTAFRDIGGKITTNLNECAKNEIIITMLPSSNQVKDVCLGPHGLFHLAAHHTCFIDCSSIDVHSARELHAAGAAFTTVDAPVSGGVAGATAGTLTFMVGGSSHAFNKIKPILMAMGKTIIHTGPAGTGQAAKICNNMILGSTMIAVAEAFLLAESLDLTANKLHEVVSHSSGQCWVIDKYVPVPGVLEQVPANHDYAAGFTAAMMLKDLRLSQESATYTHMQTPLAAKTTELYNQFAEQGLSQLDFSAIIKLLSSLKSNQ